MIGRLAILVLILLGFVQAFAAPVCPTVAVAIPTYHVDAARTGWNSHETILQPSNVSTLHQIATATADATVDASPIIAVNLSGFSAGGVHNCVYVVSENNTVFCFDDTTGATLASRHISTPFSPSNGCVNVSSTVGVLGTPTFDVVTNTLYVVTHESNGTYLLHALDAVTLADKITAVTIDATHLLSDSSTTLHFSGTTSTASLQRPALLEAGGNIYVGFGSYCDQGGPARGWLIGFNAATFAPVAGNELVNQLVTPTNSQFLGSLWMSGAGPAADASGNVYVATGNGATSGACTYDATFNLTNSEVKITGDLTTVLSSHTPTINCSLDSSDQDYGAAGTTLPPTGAGQTVDLALASGKNGFLYVMNRASLGGHSDSIIQNQSIGSCFCTQSAYISRDGITRIVSSGSGSLTIWKVATNGTITNESSISASSPGGGFTTVTSNGSGVNGGQFLVWALLRGGTGNSTLLAYDPIAHSTLVTVNVGTANIGAFPGRVNNATPIAANGKVYVIMSPTLKIYAP